MNILYIIGNGFDINLGLKTSYQSFYDYYINQITNSATIGKLKEYLTKERFGIWADLELGLGTYTSRVESVGELEEICHDLSYSLRKYLSAIQSSFVVQNGDKQKLSDFLVSPHISLLEGNARSLGSFVNSNGSKSVNAISFNYTNTFEKLTGYRGSAVPLNSHDVLRSVRHVHLSLNNTDVILGVNDESQISNKSFIVPEVLDLMVKPHINEQLGTLVDYECRSLIGSADIICLFGVSLGDTDKCWWEEIGKNMSGRNVRLVYYAFDNDNPQYNNQLIGKHRSYLNKLLEKCGLPIDSKTIRNQVYVGYKTGFFKIR